jgi:hypothetical protein
LSLLIEGRRDWHVGFHRGAPDDAGRTAIWQVNLGIITLIWFRGSLSDLLVEWQHVADQGVREAVERWVTAETIGRN